MHNWWLAALENFGIVTREQAEHIGKEIKSSIHKDSYIEAYDDLKIILDKNKDLGATPFSKLEDKLFNLEQEVKGLKKEAPPLVPIVDEPPAKTAIAHSGKPQ